MIALISPYTVGVALPFSTTIYTLYAAIAKAKLDAEDPGLPSTIYDYCQALLVVHDYEVKRGATNVKSKSFGNASVTKEDADSNYMMEYRSIMASYSKGVNVAVLSSGVERCDSEMDDLRLDEGDIPSYEEDP
jgi:hypothetical protein